VIKYGGKAAFLQHRSGGGIAGYMEGAVITAGSVAKRI
jgi:hypothetical protein